MDSDHFDSKEEARSSYEKGMKTSSTLPKSKKTLKSKPTKKVSIPRASTIIKGIDTPEGFTKIESTAPMQGHGAYAWGGHKVLTLEGEGVKISIEFYKADPEDFSLGSGHVTFSTSHGERTFDRRGVEDSFYVDNPGYKYSTSARDPIEETNKTIRDMIDRRIPEARLRADNSERVPGLSFTVTPERRDSLKKTGRLSLTPGGFGRGYTFTTKKNSWAQPATEEQKKFFGVPALWVETTDHD
jgi:hypothetical protein